MPSYLFSLAVPAGTTEAAPVEQVVELAPGNLKAVTFLFPPGPRGEVGVRLLHNRHTLYPSRNNQWFAWDAGEVKVELDHELIQGETSLVIQAKSPTANFAHDIGVKLDLQPSSAPDTGLDEQAEAERVWNLIAEGDA